VNNPGDPAFAVLGMAESGRPTGKSARQGRFLR
jgi:hypothetical protein